MYHECFIHSHDKNILDVKKCSCVLIAAECTKFLLFIFFPLLKIGKIFDIRTDKTVIFLFKVLNSLQENIVHEKMEFIFIGFFIMTIIIDIIFYYI